MAKNGIKREKLAKKLHSLTHTYTRSLTHTEKHTHYSRKDVTEKWDRRAKAKTNKGKLYIHVT